MKNVGLVIEGGGFRGIYTAGFLDYFLDRKWYFPVTYGVSMGACNGANYISRQRGRSLQQPFRFLDDPRYMGMKHFITKGSLFNMDFIFREIPYNESPFDFEQFASKEQKFISVATDCITGKPAYLDKEKLSQEESLKAIEASSSLPFIAKMVTIRGHKYLDGGLSDSIPVRKILEEEGIEKVIILLTRPRGYRKKITKNTQMASLFYRQYPKVAEAINRRSAEYNATLDFIDELEKEGKVLPIYPDEPIDIGRTEKNKYKMMRIYQGAYHKAEKMGALFEAFIEEEPCVTCPES